MSKKKIAFIALGFIVDALFAFLCYAKGKEDGYAEAKEELNYDDCDCDCCCNGGAKCCDIADNAVNAVSDIEAEGDALQPNDSYGSAEVE